MRIIMHINVGEYNVRSTKDRDVYLVVYGWKNVSIEIEQEDDGPDYG
jgi:hypothetical protein